MDHLPIKEILQLTINAIDNETLWEKHYENLRKIEKDLRSSTNKSNPQAARIQVKTTLGEISVKIKSTKDIYI